MAGRGNRARRAPVTSCWIRRALGGGVATSSSPTTTSVGSRTEATSSITPFRSMTPRTARTIVRGTRRNLGAPRLPNRGQLRIRHERASKEDRHHAVDDEARAQPLGNPRQLAIARHILRRLGLGRRLQQRQGVQQVGAAGRQPHADEATHRESHEVARARVEPLDHRHRVAVAGLHVVTAPARITALSLAAMIVGDAPVPIRNASICERHMRDDIISPWLNTIAGPGPPVSS